jgi:hypothetical protein
VQNEKEQANNVKWKNSPFAGKHSSVCEWEDRGDHEIPDLQGGGGVRQREERRDIQVESDK